MKEQGFTFNYTVAQFKPKRSYVNESKIGNTLNREFNQNEDLKVILSDLTYVRVQHKWHYICVFTDLFNREINGHSASSSKDTKLVQKAFVSVKYNSNRHQSFHTVVEVN